jgi:hypothetical protein
MNQFGQILSRILVITGFSMIFMLAVVFLRPFRVNVKRKISTYMLKFSYLAYLLVALSFFYYLVFLSIEIKDKTNELNYIFMILSLFVPNTGILLRRKFKNNRIIYNYFFSGINLLIIIFLASKFYQMHIVI